MILHDTLQSEGKNLPLISIISPVYNTQNFLSIAIESIIKQTYPNWELIFIDDGSTDKSAEIIKRYMIEDSRIQLTQIENHGQGYARNLAVNMAKGKYIMFFDSDDYLEDIALDLAVTKLEEEKSDFVVFDYVYYSPLGKTTNYRNKDEFFSQKKLVGEECLSLLKTSPFFTVNKVYNADFLRKNEIKYGEGYIYEDIEFWVEAVLSADCVSLIHSPLYRVTVSSSSSTKTNLNTDWHCRSFITAIKKCAEILEQFSYKITDRAKYDLLLYFYDKFAYYFLDRTPKEFRDYFLKNFVDKINCFGEINDFGEKKVLSLCLAQRVFTQKRYFLFKMLFFSSIKYKPAVKKVISRFKTELKKYRSFIKKVCTKIIKKKRPQNKNVWSVYKYNVKQPLYDDVILFMGFDYRYTGNSRYLFEELKKKDLDGFKLFFATKNPLVPLENRIDPGSERLYRFVARSKIIIFESWIPLDFTHRKGTKWIQLWHGTPLKRLLFDSNERQITSKRPDNKILKYNDIKRWDYLLTDSPEIVSYFKTCFLFPESKQLTYGYPRVKYLIDKKNDKKYKDFLKDLLGVTKEKKILLYLPTWRDCNYSYGKEEKEFDLSYIADLKKLQELLGEEYEIVYKDHVFLSRPENVDFINFGDAETQELLLIADFLLTDFSSVMFDAFAIDLPVVLYCNDFEKNEMDRGVYKEMWECLQPFVCENLNKVCEKVKTYRIDEDYQNLKEKYSYSPEGCNLADFILELGRK